MDLDIYPEKESSRPNGVSNDALQKMISQWKRDDLEDKYLRLYDDHIRLKKHARKQEDKIKRMATKLIRLAQDQNRLPGGKAPHSVTTVEELKLKIEELQRANTVLQDKLLVARNQLEMMNGTRSSSNFDSIQPRVSKGVSKTPGGAGVRPENLRVFMPAKGSVQLTRRSTEDRSFEDRNRLELAIVRLNEELNIKEQQIEDLKEQIRIKEVNFEEDLLRMKQRSAVDVRTSANENLDFIKLQRELKEKAAALSALHMKFQQAENQMVTLESTNRQLMNDVERLNHQLRLREEQSVRLQSEGKLANSAQKRNMDLEQMITDLKAENEVLRSANDRLTGSAFNTDRERQWQAKEKALKTQIAQLEATLHRDVGEKGSVLNKLELEHDRSDQRERELSQARIQLYELQEKYEALQERMKYFTRDSEMDMQEIEEAILLVRQRQNRGEKSLEFLHKVDDGQNKDLSRRLQESEASHAETIQELEKTRNMLIVQYKLNNDYKNEVDAITKQMEETKFTYETRLEEYAKLLDIRAARIRKLESQLKDVAYGTKQYTIKSDNVPTGDAEELVDEILSLQRGENILEIHLGRTTLTSDAMKTLKGEAGEDPQLFCTVDFYDFETQSTSVLRSSRPDFDITAQYPVKVDDFFLHYLQKDSCTVELHRAIGAEFETIAAGQLVCRTLLDTNHEQKGSAVVQASCQLIGVLGELTGYHVATLDYWIRLRVPMTTALRLYRERMKALGYLANNTRSTEEAIRAATVSKSQQGPVHRAPPYSISSSANQLHIKVIRCNNLRARAPDRQPSPYVLYKFFDYENEDTDIVPLSNHPQFFYHKVFPVHMTLELDKFLRSQSIKFYVFDDVDPVDDGGYLGIATVPLLPLAHDRKIEGEFELDGMSGGKNGTIQLELAWQHPYMPGEAALTLEIPEASTHTRADLLPGEESIMTGTSVKVAKKDATKTIAEKPMVQTQPSAEKASSKGILKRPSDEISQEKAKQIDVPAAPVKPHEQAEEQVKAGRSPVPSPPMKQATMEDVKIHRISPTKDDSLRSSDKGNQDEGSSEMTNVSQDIPSSKSIKEPYVVERPPSEVELGKRSSSSSTEKSKARIVSPTQIASGASSDNDVVVAPKPRPSPRKGNGIIIPDDEMAPAETLTLRGPSENGSGSNGKNQTLSPDANTLTVEVHYVDFNSQCPELRRGGKNDNRMVYVAYELLNLPEEETETPSSLPMPKLSDVNKKVDFNFSRTFSIDFENNYIRRQLLARMLLKDDPTNGRIDFSIIDEPDSEQGEEDDQCAEIGQGSVSVREIYKRGRDWDSEAIPIYSKSKPNLVIAQLNVSVKVLSALRAIVQEMPDTELCLT